MNMAKIQYFIKKIPDQDLLCSNNLHYLMTVHGILSYYNFNSIDIQPNFKLNTRIYSDNEKFSHKLTGEISFKKFIPKKQLKQDEFEPEKIKNVNTIRRKRLFVKMKERIANLTITSDSGFYYKNDNPDLNSIPEYCDLKAKCSSCNEKCTYTIEEIKILPIKDLKNELKLHKIIN